MRFLILVTVLLFSFEGFGQVNRYYKYAEQPTDLSYYHISDNTYEQLKSALLVRQAQYDALKQKLEYIEQRIFDLKILNNRKDLLFESELDGVQNKIDYLRDKDLTLYSREIDKLNPAINKAYLEFVNRPK